MIFVRFTSLNRFRITKAEQYYAQGNNTDDQRDKVTLLILSNSLVPSVDKESKIADLYLKLGDYRRAKRYLVLNKSQEGILVYAESALQFNDFNVAKEMIAKIKDSEIQNELNVFSKVAITGRADSIKYLSITPRTNLGIILKAINTGDYSLVSSGTIIGSKIKEIINQYPGRTRQQLETGDTLNTLGQPRLAILAVNALAENTDLIGANTIKARSYYLLRDYDAALSEQLLAVKINPADVTLYETALIYSNLSSNQTESAWLIENIQYLKKIKSN